MLSAVEWRGVYADVTLIAKSDRQIEKSEAENARTKIEIAWVYLTTARGQTYNLARPSQKIAKVGKALPPTALLLRLRWNL